MFLNRFHVCMEFFYASLLNMEFKRTLFGVSQGQLVMGYVEMVS